MDEKKVLKDLFSHEPFVYYGITSPYYIGYQKLKEGSFGSPNLAICERFYCYGKRENQISLTREAAYCQLKEIASQELMGQEIIEDIDGFISGLKPEFKKDIMEQFELLIEYENEHKEG